MNVNFSIEEWKLRDVFERALNEKIWSLIEPKITELVKKRIDTKEIVKAMEGRLEHIFKEGLSVHE